MSKPFSDLLDEYMLEIDDLQRILNVAGDIVEDNEPYATQTIRSIRSTAGAVVDIWNEEQEQDNND